MARIYNTFDFVGNISLPKDTTKLHGVKRLDTGWNIHKLNLGIRDEAKLNTVFLDLQAFQSENKPMVVYGMYKDEDGEGFTKFTTPWEDRQNVDMDKVADFVKIIVDLETDDEVRKERNQLLGKIRELEKKEGTEDSETEKLDKYKAEVKPLLKNRHEFLTEYDAIVFLRDNILNYTDKKFRARGNIVLSESKGNIYRNYTLKTLEIVEDSRDSKTSAKADIFFTGDAIDDRYEEEGKVYIKGYLQDRDNRVKEDRFFPQEFVFNFSKLDKNNERHMARKDFLMTLFEEIEDADYVSHLLCNISVFRGADKVDIEYDDLTDMQKRSIDAGVKTLEDFQGNIYGKTYEELRIIGTDLKGDFENGSIASGVMVDDLESLIASSTESVTLEDVKEVEEDKKDVEVEKTDAQLEKDIDDLLG